MLDAIRHEAAERRRRLMTPPNGFVSSELDVISSAAMREKRRLIAARITLLERRWTAFKRARDFQKYIDMHRRPQPVIPNEPPLIDGSATWPITVRDICRMTCRFYEINILDFASRRRHAQLVRARQVASYLCREMTMRSLPQIAKLMGNRDHTTILHGIQRIKGFLEFGDEDLRQEIEAIRGMLGPQP